MASSLCLGLEEHTFLTSTWSTVGCVHVLMWASCVVNVCTRKKIFYLWNKMPSDIYRMRQRTECQPKAIIMLMKPMVVDKFIVNVNHEGKCQKTMLILPLQKKPQMELAFETPGKGPIFPMMPFYLNQIWCRHTSYPKMFNRVPYWFPNWRF